MYNETQIIGKIITKINTNVTGSETLTYIGGILLVIGIMSGLKVPFEFQVVFLTPLTITLMAYSSSFVVPGSILLIVLAVLVVKYSFFD